MPEPLGGAHRDWAAAAETLRAELSRNLQALSLVGPDELRTRRAAKYRRIGVFFE